MSAEAAYRQAAAGGNPDAAFQLGVLLTDKRQFMEAADAYELAAAAGDAEAILNLAGLYADELDRPSDAEHLYRRAIELGDQRAIFDLGFFFERRGDEAGALECYRQVADAGQPRGHLHQGFLLADETEPARPADALEAFEHATSLKVQEAWTQVGWQQLRIGKPEASEDPLRRALAADQLAAALLLAETLKSLGRGVEATAVLKESTSHAQTRVSLDYRALLSRLDGEGLNSKDLDTWAKEEFGPRPQTELVALLFDASRLATAETRLIVAIAHGDEEARITLRDLYELTGRARQAAQLPT